MREKRRAISEVISTTILVAAMLIIVVGVMGFALQLFSVQSQNAEFSQAQSGVVSLAQSIDSIIPTKGSSAFSTFNTRSGGPVLMNNFDTMRVIILGPANNVVYNKSIAINEFRYQAGSQVSFEGYQWLRAGPYNGLPFASSFNKTLIIQNNAAPLGFVYISHDRGATWVTMDYRRINVNNLGVFNVSLGAIPNGVDSAGNTIYKQVFQLVNIIQVNYVYIAPGSFSGANTLAVVATNIAVNATSVSINSPPQPQPKGYYNITFRVSLSQPIPSSSGSFVPSQTLVLQVPSVGPNNQPVAATLINIMVTTIQLSYQGA